MDPSHLSSVGEDASFGYGNLARYDFICERIFQPVRILHEEVSVIDLIENSFALLN